MRQRSGRLYSQMLLPFWRPMAGYIAIGLHAAAEPLVDFDISGNQGYDSNGVRFAKYALYYTFLFLYLACIQLLHN